MQGTNGEDDRRRLGIGTRRGMSLRDRLRAEDSYGILLVMILAALILTAAAGESDLGRAVAVIAQGGVLLYALRTSRAGRTALRTAAIVVPAIVAVAAVLTRGESDSAVAGVAVASATLSAAAIAAIVRRVGAHPRVDAATILGALSTYLLIGMFFSSVFATVGAVQDQAFFVTGPAPSSVDYLYFSYVTMTTVGYGDLTAASSIGRMLAVTEALIGQMYLVTVVALVIGNIGRERRRP